MIIKGQAPRDHRLNKKISSALILVLVSVAIYFILKKVTSDSNFNASDHSTTIFCGAEYKSDSNTFVNGKHKFDNGKTQSNKFAFEGEYSSEINGKNQYGIAYQYEAYKPNDEIEISVWIKSNNPESIFLVAMSPTEEEFYHQTNDNFLIKDGWIQRKLSITLPEKKEVNPIKIYTYTSDKTKEGYVDNLKLVNRSESIRSGLLSQIDAEEGELIFTVKGMNKLSNKRDEALALGLLVKGEDDWVKAKFKTSNLEETEVKARLKGDWTDHLAGDFWSYRVKMPSETSWNRIMTL